MSRFELHREQVTQLVQHEDLKFNPPLDTYEAIETELPYQPPEQQRVLGRLNSLKQDLRTQIIDQGVPQTREELANSARRAESMRQGAPTHFFHSTLAPTPASSSMRTAKERRTGSTKGSTWGLKRTLFFQDLAGRPDPGPRVALTPIRVRHCLNRVRY